MANTEKFTNAGHSYTEAGLFDEQPNSGNKTETAEPTHDLSVLIALQELLKLHHREKDGDETITMKEWNNAIKDGEAVLIRALINL